VFPPHGHSFKSLYITTITHTPWFRSQLNFKDPEIILADLSGSLFSAPCSELHTMTYLPRPIGKWYAPSVPEEAWNKSSNTYGRMIYDVTPCLSLYFALYFGHDSLRETEKYLKFSCDLFPKAMELFEHFTAQVFPEVNYDE